MTNREAGGAVMFCAALLGCFLGEWTRRRHGQSVGAFDVFGWFLGAVAFGVAVGWW